MEKGNRAVGKEGETLAARFLARKGYRIMGKNVKTFVGEIDIVASKEKTLVFVEVKTRCIPSFAPPHDSVTERKKRKLIQCALCYLKMKDITDTPWQIDVVSIEIKPFHGFLKQIHIEHFEDAIEENDG